jgi:hypothetical protein
MVGEGMKSHGIHSFGLQVALQDLLNQASEGVEHKKGARNFHEYPSRSSSSSGHNTKV